MSKIFHSKIFLIITFVLTIIVISIIYFFTVMKTMSTCGVVPSGDKIVKACTKYKCQSDNLWTYIPRDERNTHAYFVGPICSDGNKAIKAN